MKTNRNGKIARLPNPLRDELNHRIQNAERGPKLLAWLNSHPDVQKVLADQFENRPISQQNLSEWRRGGYEEWVELQEKNHLTLQMLEHAGTFAADLNPQKINAALATIAAAESAHTALAKLKACTDTDQRWQCLGEIEERLSRRLRNDFRTGNLALRREKWDYKLAADKLTAEQAAVDEERRQMLAYFQLQPELQENAKKRGGSDAAYDHCAFLLELEHNLKVGFLDRKTPDPDSEGRVPRVPNTEHPESSISSEPSPSSIQNPASSIDSNPIALANSCTPEEFAARSATPYGNRQIPTRHPSHATCHFQGHSSFRPAGRQAVAKTGGNKVKQTATKPACAPQPSK